MGKSCLYKLNQSILVDCTVPQVGIRDIYLMHAADVSFVTDAGGNVTGVSFASDANSYRVEGYKQNIQLTTSILATDAALKLAVSVMFKIPATNTYLMRTILSGRYCVLVVRNSEADVLVGVQSPLECSGFDYDSNSGAGLATVTLSAPEGSPGNYLMGLTSSASNAIISKSV